MGRGGSFLSRDVRVLTGGRVHANVGPAFIGSAAPVLRQIAARLDRAPQNATVQPSPDALQLLAPRAGIRVTPAALAHAMGAALLSGSTRAVVPVRPVPATVTIPQLRRRYPSYITIDRGKFRLRLYQHLRLARSYPIAVGMQGLQTPAGLYHILNKVVDPSWDVPNSPWAGSLAGQTIPPGPEDPLKARWLGFWDGSGIHGTDETDSIGTAGSHGCVRMLIPDVIELYNKVQVGAPPCSRTPQLE
jgi:lipoprotein-anchoring transpeptidase ErfK/SrfK